MVHTHACGVCSQKVSFFLIVLSTKRQQHIFLYLEEMYLERAWILESTTKSRGRLAIVARLDVVPPLFSLVMKM